MFYLCFIYLCFAFLKWGSGYRKNIFVSCPFSKKFGKYLGQTMKDAGREFHGKLYFMAFERRQATLLYWPGCWDLKAVILSFT